MASRIIFLSIALYEVCASASLRHFSACRLFFIRTNSKSSTLTISASSAFCFNLVSSSSSFCISACIFAVSSHCLRESLAITMASYGLLPVPGSSFSFRSEFSFLEAAHKQHCTGMHDLGLLLMSNDLRADEVSRDSLRARTTAAGATHPIPVCEVFNSSLSPSENSHENALCLKSEFDEAKMDKNWLIEIPT
nr:hypothetical protein Iba_chr03cCG0660 [Ipomoea batatas]